MAWGKGPPLKGPPLAMGGYRGGPSKEQLGPDPHLGALDKGNSTPRGPGEAS